MKRCFFAAGALLVVNIGLAAADYVIIRIDPDAPPPQPTQVAGAQDGGAGPGAGGGKGLGMGAGGAGGGGGKGLGMGAGGAGGKGMGLGGAGGQAPPGSPGAGGYGGYGPGGAYGNQPPNPKEEAAKEKAKYAPLKVYAFLEVRSKLKVPATGFVEFDSKVTNLFAKLFVPKSYVDQTYIQAPSVKSVFNVKMSKIQNEPASKSANKPNEFKLLAEWALQRGLYKEFRATIEELKKLDENNAVVKAIEKTEKQLAARPKLDDPSAIPFLDELRKEQYRTIISDGGHYTFATNVPATEDGDLKRRIAKMEEVYATFFYWHALKGRPLPMPDNRMVVVLVKTPMRQAKEFEVKRAYFDNIPLVGSGFTAPRDNVVVMASRRLDPVYSHLEETNSTLWSTYSINQDLLLTDFVTALKQPMVQLKGKEMPDWQSKAVCQKAMDEETELMTLSHEGVRQLVAATGLLPRNVATATWAKFGLGSFFEIPAQSFYPSYGGANWFHLVRFKALSGAKVIDQKDASEILVKIVGDEYFRQANKTASQTPPKDKADLAAWKAKAQDQKELAEATAWGLMYYLKRERPEALDRYLQEIRNLPRDLEFDAAVLRNCFYRALDLLMPDPENPNREMVNIGKLDTLAAEWFTLVGSQTTLDMPFAEEMLVKIQRADMYSRAHPESTTPTDVAATDNQGGPPGYGGPGGGAPPGYGGPGGGAPPAGPGGRGPPPGQGGGGGGGRGPGGGGY
jgi:hypothetical protein